MIFSFLWSLLGRRAWKSDLLPAGAWKSDLLPADYLHKMDYPPCCFHATSSQPLHSIKCSPKLRPFFSGKYYVKCPQIGHLIDSFFIFRLIVFLAHGSLLIGFFGTRIFQ
jgi:hypothetical protein